MLAPPSSSLEGDGAGPQTQDAWGWEHFWEKEIQGPMVGTGAHVGGRQVKLRNHADAQLASPGSRPMLDNKYHRLCVESQGVGFEADKDQNKWLG